MITYFVHYLGYVVFAAVKRRTIILINTSDIYRFNQFTLLFIILVYRFLCIDRILFIYLLLFLFLLFFLHA